MFLSFFSAFLPSLPSWFLVLSGFPFLPPFLSCCLPCVLRPLLVCSCPSFTPSFRFLAVASQHEAPTWQVQSFGAPLQQLGGCLLLVPERTPEQQENLSLGPKHHYMPFSQNPCTFELRSGLLDDYMASNVDQRLLLACMSKVLRGCSRIADQLKPLKTNLNPKPLL